VLRGQVWHRDISRSEVKLCLLNELIQLLEVAITFKAADTDVSSFNAGGDLPHGCHCLFLLVRGLANESGVASELKIYLIIYFRHTLDDLVGVGANDYTWISLCQINLRDVSY
jgi:hypothetical protein